jgi:hypothetical protein
MNYFVPNFGMDSDIIDSMSNEKSAEKLIGGTVPVPKSDSKASLAQVDLGVDRDIMSV